MKIVEIIVIAFIVLSIIIRPHHKQLDNYTNAS